MMRFALLLGRPLATLLIVASLCSPAASLASAQESAAPVELAPVLFDAPIATLTDSGWATVVQATAPEILRARNGLGDEFEVSHIGIIGPSAGQGEWRPRATDQHRQLLPAGTRVWLEAQEGLANPRDRLALRHVFREDDRSEPVGAALLRAGSVWIFPHAMHAFVSLYADRQAEAVISQAGAWGETNSSAIFRPRGASFGGFPIAPRVQPALEALDKPDVGNELLKRVNAFPVEVGVERQPQSAGGAFAPRFYSIQLSLAIMDAPPESIAAVLIHEMTHANQMIEQGVSGEDLGCYDLEIQAFEASAVYWFGIYGRGGKARPTHWLDRELNETLQEYNNHQITRRVRQAYGHECGAA